MRVCTQCDWCLVDGYKDQEEGTIVEIECAKTGYCGPEKEDCDDFDKETRE